MKKPSLEIQMIYVRHNFFGYFIIDLIMFIDSDYKHLYLYQDLYNSIIRDPAKTKELMLEHLAFKEFDEPGIMFINNKIIEYHLDLLSKAIQKFVEQPVLKKKKTFEISIENTSSHQKKFNDI